MKLRQLEVLQEAVKTGSLRAAAESLGTSQPSLTVMIRNLEDELGAKLLNRSIKGVELTDIGKVVLRHSASIFSQIHYMRDDVEAEKGSPSGKLSISVAPAISLSILPSAIEKFSQRYPNVHLEITGKLLPEALDDLLNGSLDCVLGTPTEEVRRRALATPLIDIGIAIITSVGNPILKSAEKPLSELSSERWFTAGGSQHLRDFFESNGATPPESFVNCNSFMAMLALISETGGYGLVPQNFIETSFFPQISVVKTEQHPEPRSISIVTRKGSEPKRTLSYMIKCFQEVSMTA